jgi:hypothetical protein
MNHKNMGLNRVWIALGMMVAFASGCSAKIEGMDDGYHFGNKDRQLVASDEKTPLEGRWVLDCSTMGQQGFARGEISFTGNRFYSQLSVYADAGCTQFVTELQETDLFGLPTPGKINMNASGGGVLYNVYLIEKDVLYFGTTAGETDAARPAEVDRALAYKKAGMHQD